VTKATRLADKSRGWGGGSDAHQHEAQAPHDRIGHRARQGPAGVAETLQFSVPGSNPDPPI